MKRKLAYVKRKSENSILFLANFHTANKLGLVDFTLVDSFN